MTAKKAIKIKIEDEDSDNAEPKKKAAPVKKPAAKKTTKKTVKKIVVNAPVKKKPAGKVPKAAKAKIDSAKTKITVEDTEQEKEAPEQSETEDKPEVTEDKPEAVSQVDSTLTPALKKIAKKTKQKIDIEERLADTNAVKKMIAKAEKDLSTEKPPQDDDIFNIKPRRSIRLYKNIAYGFIGLTVVMLAFMFYFMFVKVTIVLIPNQERVSNNMIFDIFDQENNDRESLAGIPGVVQQIEISEEHVYDSSGTEVIGKEAVGRVTIINNYNKNQPLVATTRLLSAESKLYRIKETVNVPAGGSLEVEIYADDPSPEMAVESTRFTIPGLWAGLQDKIYAESKEAVVYQQKVKKHVTQDDLENSKRELKQLLLAKAKAEINESYSTYSQIIYKIDESSIKGETFAEVEEEINEFRSTMSAKVVVVAFDDKASANLARQKFTTGLSENKELISFDNENIIYNLNNYDYVEGAATVNAMFEGKVTLKENSDIIEIDKILGLNKSQLEVYLNEIPEIAGYQINFYPSFIHRVPKLVDRINIEIKK